MPFYLEMSKNTTQQRDPDLIHICYSFLTN